MEDEATHLRSIVRTQQIQIDFLKEALSRYKGVAVYQPSRSLFNMSDAEGDTFVADVALEGLEANNGNTQSA